jgi:hypothetical protein
MGMKLVSNIKGGTQIDGVWEMGTKENIWTNEMWSDKWMEITAQWVTLKVASDKHN